MEASRSRAARGRRSNITAASAFYKRWKTLPQDASLHRPPSMPNLQTQAVRAGPSRSRPESALSRGSPTETGVRALHKQLARSLAENTPAAVVMDMAHDPTFAFRNSVAEALDEGYRYNRRHFATNSLSSMGVDLGQRHELFSRGFEGQAVLPGYCSAADRDQAWSETNLETFSSRGDAVKAKSAVAETASASDLQESAAHRYDKFVAMLDLLRCGAVVLLKGQWLVDFSESIKLQITVTGARGLRNTDFGSDHDKSDPYVVCKIPAKAYSQWRSKTIQDNLNPVWNQTFEMSTYVAGDSLEFTVYDDDGERGGALEGAQGAPWPF
eukprot:TRINITY_DN13674_c0_g1_i1.p1 TRINITY_DN13674_c0_g1~~TRINITY_DN13674_c0_g1_i1.p1  ORF type:complete len:326 (-),score=49.46 TRINITY_DN13674_c0_g1_i1:627-1604(-)